MRDQWDARVGGQNVRLVADPDGLDLQGDGSPVRRYQWRMLLGLASPTLLTARLRFAEEPPLDVTFASRDEHQAFRDYVEARSPGLNSNERPRPLVSQPAPVAPAPPQVVGTTPGMGDAHLEVSLIKQPAPQPPAAPTEFAARAGGQEVRLLGDGVQLTVQGDGTPVRRYQWRMLLGLASPTLLTARLRFAEEPPLDVTFASRDEHQAFRDYVEARSPGVLPAAAGATTAAGYASDGTCLGCGKPVHDGARALHPRYCTAAPTTAPKGAGPVPPPRPPGPAATRAPAAGTNAGVTKLVGAAAVFIICSIVQAAGGSSMFSTTYSESNGLILGFLINLTFYPGWVFTAALVFAGIIDLVDRS